MTHDTKSSRRLAPLSAATLAAFLLAGCSTDHIGESWQCPLAAGGSCNSVAAADPAVLDPKVAGGTVLGEPLWQVRERAPDAPVEEVCTAGCGGGFDPFGWLRRLFGESNDGDEGRSAARQPEPVTASGTRTLPSGPDRQADPTALPTAPEAAEPRLAEQATPALPAEPETVEQDPAAGDLRTSEVIGRIWIAPFVDADGVYREASHVRVVLEPARWRLR